MNICFLYLYGLTPKKISTRLPQSGQTGAGKENGF